MGRKKTRRQRFLRRRALRGCERRRASTVDARAKDAGVREAVSWLSPLAGHAPRAYGYVARTWTTTPCDRALFVAIPNLYCGQGSVSCRPWVSPLHALQSGDSAFAIWTGVGHARGAGWARERHQVSVPYAGWARCCHQVSVPYAGWAPCCHQVSVPYARARWWHRRGPQRPSHTRDGLELTTGQLSGCPSRVRDGLGLATEQPPWVHDVGSRGNGNCSH